MRRKQADNEKEAGCFKKIYKKSFRQTQGCSGMGPQDQYGTPTGKYL